MICLIKINGYSTGWDPNHVKIITRKKNFRVVGAHICRQLQGLI